MHTVAVLALDGVIGLELTGACQIFATATGRTGEPLYDVRVCGDRDGTSVRAYDRPVFRAEAPYDLAAALTAGTVVVPASVEPAPDVVEVIREAHRRGVRIASICTGAFLLAAAGVLDGRRATTHWDHAARLARQYPAVEVVTDALYIDEGDVLTSAGVTAGLDLCLHLVRRDHGLAVASAVARRLVMAPHRDGGQAQYVPAPVVADNDSLTPLQDWMTAHLADPLTLASLAAQASMSTRTLSRRFRAQTGTTPLQWLINQRLHRARELLETTDLGVDQIAAATGFGSAVVLRQHFARVLSTTPSRYRRTFAPPAAETTAG